MSENSSSYIDLEMSSNEMNDGQKSINELSNQYDIC